MGRTLLLIILILCFRPLYAQTYWFKGRIISQEGAGLPYAVVTISGADSGNKGKFVKITSDDGFFRIPIGSPKGRHFIQITHVSMDTLTEEIDFQDTIGRVYRLKPRAHQLADAMVVNSTPLIVRKLDKIVLNVEDNAAAIGKNTFSLLQMAPGVQVQGGNVSINGIPGARIYVNGVPLQLSGSSLQTYLNGLRSSDIKSIEIIAHPSSEYSAEGVAGIINVITRRPSFTGLNGSAGYDQSFGLGKYPGDNPYASISFARDKIQLSARYNYSDQKTYSTGTQLWDVTSDGMQSSNTQTTGVYNSQNVSIGGSYDFSKTQNLSIYYNGSFSKDTESISSVTTTTYPDSPRNNNVSSGLFPNSSNIKYDNWGLNYNWTTDTLNSQLTIAADYTYNNNSSVSVTNSKTYDAVNAQTGDTLYNYNFPSVSKIGTADAKYTKIFRSGTEFKLGGRYSDVDINTNNFYTIFEDNVWKNDSSAAFTYHYKEGIFAAFAEVSGKIRSIEYKLGIRGENSYVQGMLKSTGKDSSNTQRYFNFFPTIVFGRTIDKKKRHHLSISYNRRISRPSFTALNPYKYYLNTNEVTSGNPYLKPSFMDNIDLGYTLKNKYFFDISYTHLAAQISRITTTDQTTDLINQIWLNIGNTNVYSMSMSAPISVTKWWTTNNTLLLQYKDVNSPGFQIKKGTFTFQTFQSIIVNPSLSFSLWGFYTPLNVYGNIVTGQYSNVSIGIRKKLYKSRLILGANIDDLFYQNNASLTSYYDNTKLYNHPKFQTRVLSLSVLYNFKLGKAFTVKELEQSNENERSRLK